MFDRKRVYILCVIIITSIVVINLLKNYRTQLRKLKERKVNAVPYDISTDTVVNVNDDVKVDLQKYSFHPQCKCHRYQR